MNITPREWSVIIFVGAVVWLAVYGALVLITGG
jgi:hypothetical protein